MSENDATTPEADLAIAARRVLAAFALKVPMRAALVRIEAEQGTERAASLLHLASALAQLDLDFDLERDLAPKAAATKTHAKQRNRIRGARAPPIARRDGAARRARHRKRVAASVAVAIAGARQRE